MKIIPRHNTWNSKNAVLIFIRTAMEDCITLNIGKLARTLLLFHNPIKIRHRHKKFTSLSRTSLPEARPTIKCTVIALNNSYRTCYHYILFYIRQFTYKCNWNVGHRKSPVSDTRECDLVEKRI